MMKNKNTLTTKKYYDIIHLINKYISLCIIFIVLGPRTYGKTWSTIELLKNSKHNNILKNPVVFLFRYKSEIKEASDEIIGEQLDDIAKTLNAKLRINLKGVYIINKDKTEKALIYFLALSQYRKYKRQRAKFKNVNWIYFDEFVDETMRSESPDMIHWFVSIVGTITGDRTNVKIIMSANQEFFMYSIWKEFFKIKKLKKGITMIDKTVVEFIDASKDVEYKNRVEKTPTHYLAKLAGTVDSNFGNEINDTEFTQVKEIKTKKFYKFNIVLKKNIYGVFEMSNGHMYISTSFNSNGKNFILNKSDFQTGYNILENEKIEMFRNLLNNLELWFQTEQIYLNFVKYLR